MWLSILWSEKIVIEPPYMHIPSWYRAKNWRRLRSKRWSHAYLVREARFRGAGGHCLYSRSSMILKKPGGQLLSPSRYHSPRMPLKSRFFHAVMVELKSVFASFSPLRDIRCANDSTEKRGRRSTTILRLSSQNWFLPYRKIEFWNFKLRIVE